MLSRAVAIDCNNSNKQTRIVMMLLHYRQYYFNMECKMMKNEIIDLTSFVLNKDCKGYLLFNIIFLCHHGKLEG